MQNFDIATHQGWLNTYHTKDVIKRIERIRDNLLKQSALLADKTDYNPQEVHKLLIRANALTSILSVLNEGNFTTPEQLI